MRDTCNYRKLFDDIVNNLERMKRNIDCNNQLIEGDLERRNGLSEGIGLAIDIVKETARLNKIIYEKKIMVFATGDIHGNPFNRFSTDAFYEQKEFSKNKDENVCIICGDFGIVWQNYEESSDEQWKLDWLESKPFTTVFVDGNHDNHPQINMYPVQEWNGGLVHQIRPHVLHLIRGEVYEIQGKKFFCFGGASSHDIQDGILDPYDFKDIKEFKNTWKKWEKEYRMFRVKGITWWSQELPTEEEMQNGIKNLEKHNWKVDYIITHSPPASVIALLGKGLYEQDVLTEYLEEIRVKTEYERWIAGHMHTNKAINAKDILLYEQIIRIV